MPLKPPVIIGSKTGEAYTGVGAKVSVEISDPQLDQELIARINDLHALSEEDRQHIMRTLGALIREAKIRKVFG